MIIYLSNDLFGKNLRRIRMTEAGRIRQIGDSYFASLCAALHITDNELFSTAQ